MAIFTGKTDDDYIEITSQKSTTDTGLRIFGALQNTDGSNSIDIQITASDIWGTKVKLSDVFTVAPGGILNFDTLTGLVSGTPLSILPPYIYVQFEVKSTTTGLGANYDMRVMYF